MYWRERRLTPGLYTDGKVVYESAYRYTDGRAGMKPVSNLDAFLQSSTIKRDVKEDLLKRLKNDSPDVVVEEWGMCVSEFWSWITFLSIFW